MHMCVCELINGDFCVLQFSVHVFACEIIYTQCNYVMYICCMSTIPAFGSSVKQSVKLGTKCALLKMHF